MARLSMLNLHEPFCRLTSSKPELLQRKKSRGCCVIAFIILIGLGALTTAVVTPAVVVACAGLVSNHTCS